MLLPCYLALHLFSTIFNTGIGTVEKSRFTTWKREGATNGTPVPLQCSLLSNGQSIAGPNPMIGLQDLCSENHTIQYHALSVCFAAAFQLFQWLLQR